LLLNVNVTEKDLEGTTKSASAALKKKNTGATILRAEWLCVLMKEELYQQPNLSNKAMKGFLHEYAAEHFFTDNMLQNTHSNAKLQNFGEPSANVRYAYHLQSAMLSQGHRCELVTVNCGTVVSSISQILVDDENCCRYKQGMESMDGDTQVAFLAEWLSKNKCLLDNQMGVGTGNKYLSGILFTILLHLRLLVSFRTYFKLMSCDLWEVYNLYSVWIVCGWINVLTNFCYSIW
jgi:hypothetical protein